MLVRHLYRMLPTAWNTHACMHAKSLQSCPTLCDPWTVAHQAPLSMGFPRQQYWSGLPFPSPGQLSDPGIKPRSPALQADSLPSEPPGQPISFCRWFIHLWLCWVFTAAHGLFVAVRRFSLVAVSSLLMVEHRLQGMQASGVAAWVLYVGVQ